MTVGNTMAGEMSAKLSTQSSSPSSGGSLVGKILRGLGDLVSGVADFAGFDGSLGYEGNIDGQRHFSLENFGKAVGVDAIGDTLGLDGKFGYQGDWGGTRQLSMGGLRDAAGSVFGRSSAVELTKENLLATAIGSVEIPTSPAHMNPKYTERFPGIYREGRVLKGTVLFSNNVNLTDKQVDDYLSSVNHNYGAGYKIDINFKAASWLDRLLGRATVNVQFGGDGYRSDGSIIEGSAAPGPGPLTLFSSSTPATLPSVIKHEFLHMLGLVHSNSKSSVMYPYSGAGSNLTTEEARGLIFAYPTRK